MFPGQGGQAGNMNGMYGMFQQGGQQQPQQQAMQQGGIQAGGMGGQMQGGMGGQLQGGMGVVPAGMQQAMQSGMGSDPSQQQQQMAALYQQGNPQAMAQMQAMYQQYALRWAAMQRFAAQAQAAQGMGGGVGVGGGMGGGPQGFGGGGPAGSMGRGHGGSGFGGGMVGAGGEDGGGGSAFFRTRVCNKWRDGHCPYGDKCRYAHGEGDLRPLGDTGGGGGNFGGQGFGGGGGRGFGGNMGAGRGIGRGRGVGPAAGGPQDPQEKRAMIDLMKKTRLCDEFMQTGVCKYGDRCTFAHGEHELRAVPNMNDVQQIRQQVQQTAQPTGQAPFASKDTMRKTRLCERFMATGLCNYGDTCSFAHGQHELRQRAPGTPGPGPAIGAAAKPIGPAVAARPAASSAAIVAPAVRLLDGAGKSVDQDAGGDQAAGVKRRLDEEAEVANGSGAKRSHLEPAVSLEPPEPAPSCPLCAQLVASGKAKVLAAVQALENPKAKQVGCMIAAAAPRLDQLWHRCTPSTVMAWIARASLSLTDKIELLKSVVFHVHNDSTEAGGEDGGSRAGIEAAQKYVAMGLPPAVADFVLVCMEGQEGTASMSEYFHLLEVVKALFGIDDESYYQVSSATASICMGM